MTLCACVRSPFNIIKIAVDIRTDSIAGYPCLPVVVAAVLLIPEFSLSLVVVGTLNRRKRRGVAVFALCQNKTTKNVLLTRYYRALNGESRFQTCDFRF